MTLVISKYSLSNVTWYKSCSKSETNSLNDLAELYYIFNDREFLDLPLQNEILLLSLGL